MASAAAGHLQLGEDVGDVVADRCRCQSELGSDRGVATAVGDES
jgi:hypothetical protein